MSGGSPSPASSERVDLHCHSFFSDGDHAPRDVAAMARKAGLSAFALTDHDCLDGLQEFVDAAEGFLAVCGVEISARRESSDVHILGLFIDAGNEKLNRHLADLAHSRRTRSSAMVDRLRVLGIEIREDDVARFSGQGTVGRPHVAHALVEMGVVPSVDEAFRRFLRPGTPGFVPKPGPTPAEAILWIHEAGGLAVLAHPGPLRHDAWIAEIAAAGLDGIEVWHPKHNMNQRATYLRMARDLGLVASGGSDYHGTRVGDSLVGQEPVPAETVERLRARRARR